MSISPALKQADCGTSVSGATDAARGAAALILTAPGLSVINTAIDEARRIFGRINSYTIYRVALTMDIIKWATYRVADHGAGWQAKHRRWVRQPLGACEATAPAAGADVPSR